MENELPFFLHRDESIDYAVHGSGRTLMLVHGAGGNALNWPPALRRLPGWRVAAIDLPGHGKSVHAQSLGSIAELVALVLAWADALDAPTFAIAGQSLGGAIALQTALDAPDRVTHLVPVACAPRIEVNPMLLDALQNGEPSVYTTLTRYSYARTTPAERLLQYETHLRHTPANVLYDAFAACADFDVAARLPEIAAHTLVLGAVQDKMIPMQGSIDLHAGISGAGLHLFPSTGHMIHIEAPEETTQTIRAFLTEEAEQSSSAA